MLPPALSKGSSLLYCLLPIGLDGSLKGSFLCFFQREGERLSLSNLSSSDLFIPRLSLSLRQKLQNLKRFYQQKETPEALTFPCAQGHTKKKRARKSPFST